MQGWGLLFLRFKKKFQSAHALAVHLHGADSRGLRCGPKKARTGAPDGSLESPCSQDCR